MKNYFGALLQVLHVRREGAILLGGHHRKYSLQSMGLTRRRKGKGGLFATLLGHSHRCV